MKSVRSYVSSDWPAVWAILEPVFRAGDTYSFAPDISETEARRQWIDVPSATFVFEDSGGRILGTYYLKPNQPGRGSHVCNCGYVVGSAARGMGIASLMCRHSQDEASRRGFRSMQYNLVVSTNEGAVRLWKRLGFEIVGTLPGAFEHPLHGDVDAFVMFKRLGPDLTPEAEADDRIRCPGPGTRSKEPSILKTSGALPVDRHTANRRGPPSTECAPEGRG